jgi:hypothetical protein
MMSTVKLFGILLSILSVVSLSSATPLVGPITFAPGDYDNTANTVISGPTPVNNQTTGKFRDVIWWSINNGQPRVGSGDYINQGNSLYVPVNQVSAIPRPVGDPLAYSALNFTGPSISGGQSYLSIYDTTVADGAANKNVFDATQRLTISADVLFTVHSASGGVVALYNEGQDALALLAHNGGGNNADHARVDLVWQSAGQGTVLESIPLDDSAFIKENWYRVTMDLLVSGNTYTVNGTIQNHKTGTNPTSDLDIVITTVSHNGLLLSSGLSNPGEVGIMAMGNESIALPDSVGISITNFEVIPEPATVALLGLGVVALLRKRLP